ncbi:MAG: FtsX-like permease family protein [Rhodobacteraceae bacterium]|nr:FtsX-like permease family protein [Paracoccaceae bacterium]
MSAALAVRFAWRELRAGFSGFWIFLACLVLGVSALAVIGSLRAAIQAGLQQQGAALLGGDAEIALTYRFATPAERLWLDTTALRVSEVVDFRSLAVSADARTLTQVKAVDAQYPLVGEVVLEPAMTLNHALAGADGLPGAVMEAVLVAQLGLDIGDRFRLGAQEFVLTALLVREPDSASAGFALAPRTLLRSESLAQSGLLAPGTLFETRYRLDLPPAASLAQSQAQAEARFAGSGIRWRDSRNGAPAVAQFVTRLGDFLILVGLAGLAIGGVGIHAAVRAYLQTKRPVIAILRTLGAGRSTIFLTYFLQIGAFSGAGIAAALALGGLLPLVVAPFFGALLPVPAVFAFYPAALGEAALYGVLCAMIFTLWPLARAENVHPAALFRNTTGEVRQLPAPRYLLALALLIALLIGAVAAFSQARVLTLWTLAGIAAALGVLTLAALAVRALARPLAQSSAAVPTLRWALAAVSGSVETAVSVIVSLGLGLSVLAAVGQIEGNLRNAIIRDLPEVAPSYFFVDIQKEQMPEFQTLLAADPLVDRIDTAPMLRGVITHINGRPAQEVAGDHWVLEGDRGITYATAPPEEGLTAGTWWPEGYAGPPLVSFAATEAEEMGLSLGDRLTVNVLGRDITAQISSLRMVDFSMAGIGFIMVINPEALAGAPHSFIATVYAEPQAEGRILRAVSDTFGNITGIRVRDAIERVGVLLAGIASATTYGAAGALLTGGLVLIGSAVSGQRARAYEAAILKTLGATRWRILMSFALRAAFLGVAAGAVALLVGVLGAWALTYFVLETDFAVIWPNALAVVAGGLLANLLAGLGFGWAPLAAKPSQVLRTAD